MSVAPSVILEKLYSSKQSDCIDEWVRQGWCAEDSTDQNVSIADKDIKSTVKIMEQGVVSFTTMSSIGWKSIFAHFATAPIHSATLYPSISIHMKTHTNMLAQLHQIVVKLLALQPTRAEHSGIFCISPLDDSPMPVSESSSNYIATFLSGVPKLFA
ncbi:hypothetical protein D6D19_09959 [Aureobasidium pullulans]|uniref:Uncharacterized protein n=1 Tax=Aureobasidium pullulans TaxID=5580 RepID=A0A4S8ZB65_AURPU|nr:hypothetical protein D6D19_09959 [Aureobasidium pullulans]